jgi:proline iminopeptidase
MSKNMNKDIETGTIDVVGATLHYRIEGDGIPTIIVGDTNFYPREFPQAMRDHFKMAFLNLRHWEPGTIPEGGITPQLYADDVETFRKHLGWEKVVIIGHSIHGDLAINYVHLYPEHVSHVIAIGAPCYVENVQEKSIEFFQQDASEERKQMLNKNMEKAQEYYAANDIISYYVLSSQNYWYDPHYNCAWLWKDVVPNSEITTALFTSFNDYDVKEPLNAIKVPKLIVNGRYDYVCPYLFWEQHKDIPRLTIHLYEKSGHGVPLEEPEKFVDQTLRWIQNT